MIDAFFKWMYGIRDKVVDRPDKDIEPQLDDARRAREQVDRTFDMTIELRTNWMAREIMKKKVVPAHE